MDWAKETSKRDEKHLHFGICCGLYYKFDGTCHATQRFITAEDPHIAPVVRPSHGRVTSRDFLPEGTEPCSAALTSTPLSQPYNLYYNYENILWNRGFWRSLNNTYPIFLAPCIRCTYHLCDSCDLTDVNPHFIPSLLRKIQNVDPLWRHRYKSRPPAIVASQWPIVPAWLLWTLS